MYVLIEFPAGVVFEAVVLSMDSKRARVVAAGYPDTLELRRAGADWLTEGGQKVSFEFLLSGAPEADAAVLPAPALLTCATGCYAI